MYVWFFIVMKYCYIHIHLPCIYRSLSLVALPKEPRKTMNPILTVTRLLICSKRRTSLGRHIRKIIQVAATRRWILTTMLASTIPSYPSRISKRTKSVVPILSVQSSSIRILTMTVFPNTSFIRPM